MVVSWLKLQPNKGKTIHFRPLEDGHISVSVETIVSGFEDFSIPVPLSNVGLEKLGDDARGSFNSWSCAWVKFLEEVLKRCDKTNEKEPHPNKKGAVQGNDKEAMEKVKSSKGSTKLINAKDRSLVPVHVLENLTKACLWLQKCVSIKDELNSIVVEVEKSKFNYLKDTKQLVYPIDVSGFLPGLNYNVSILQVFMNALQEELSLSGKERKVGWLCPEEIRDNACFYSFLEVVAYLERSIAKSIEAKHNYILAPYLENEHWLLLCVCPLTHTIYQLDSYCPQGSRNALLVKSLLNGVMKKLKGSSRSST